MTNANIDIIKKSLVKRKRADKRFEFMGKVAVFFAISVILLLLVSITYQAKNAFHQHEIQLDIINLDTAITNAKATNSEINFYSIIKKSIYATFPKVKGRKNKKALAKIISNNAVYDLQEQLKDDDNKPKTSYWLPVNDEVDQYLKGNIAVGSKITKQQSKWIDKLVQQDKIQSFFNYRFFASGDSIQPETAGIKNAFIGSFLLVVVTLILSVGLGIMAAIYLEEFSPTNKWTYWIEININNLASVPSIIFGLLGLAMFINFMDLPRSSIIVASLTFTLMTLPTIILTTRAALKSVPPSLKEAALGLGASNMQIVMHHSVPYAMPGILTGSIIGVAQALGETAPLIMLGMVAFIANAPDGLFDAATVLPVQVYLWAGSPERAFTEKAAAAILVLLFLLILINSFAVILRHRFSKNKFK